MSTVAPTGVTAAPATPDEDVARIPSEVFVEVVRLLIVIMATAIGYGAGLGLDHGGVPTGERSVLVGALLGACLGYVVGGVVGRLLRRAMGSFEDRVDRAPAPVLLAGALGAGLLGGIGAVPGIAAVVVLPGLWGVPVLGLTAWIGVYAGFQAGARKGEELFDLVRGAPGLLGASRGRAAATTEPEGASPFVLVDSSAAMDGRLSAVAGSGFLPGPLAVPRFVIDELQGIADASDPARRRRGRRALEMLDALRDGPGMGLVVLPDEVPEREDVDAKLLALASRTGAFLLTVDHGLSQVAELIGVRCLSFHRLAASLQPVLVPGEVIRLTVSRHGRDEGQGVGFLEDGTMVVVNDGAELIGEDVDVSITSSLQTSRGRMFFASLAA